MAEKGLRFALADLEQAIRAVRTAYPEVNDDEDLLADTLEGSTDLHEVIGKLVDQAREEKAQADAVKSMIETLDTRAYRWQWREKATRALIQRLLDIAGQRKITLPQATVSIANGRKSVVIVDESKLPPQVWVAEPKVSKAKVKELLDAGDCPGAAFSNGGDVLTIR